MWNEEHAFEISSEKEAVFEVLDKENVGEDKFMGELKANLFGRAYPIHCLVGLIEANYIPSMLRQRLVSYR